MGKITCSFGKKKGHSYRVCRLKLDNSRTCYSVSCFSASGSNPLLVPFKIWSNQFEGRALIDTGSCVSLVHSRYIHQHSIQPCNLNIVGVNGSQIRQKGKVNLSLVIGDVRIDHDFVVTSDINFEYIAGL
ncbi:hypothetical protein RF11_09190 [Thelohanellus kitauei]|uniref:Peptidase A2 domain-containing protein n=1 Tax=Thelohanellus kitauei TaxID=669202 RepID=A0A0C2N4C3_THEKT|nr:hypothetical protein RF11_09190 [Thelohanellus kitauei]